MEMSLAYLEETVAAMADHGFSVVAVADAFEKEGVVVYRRNRFELTRGADQDLVLECLEYPDLKRTYWLELRRMSAIKANLFEIDSWKHRPEQVEFRYYARADGVALTFVLEL
ncbi:MAG TPA: hypothetical protein VG165_12060 [Solirubrobacteraceae bacterium]|jgi:hypothetical protein|nr:hypothetical protein [Solirubrobacteraceae bacterium]